MKKRTLMLLALTLGLVSCRKDPPAGELLGPCKPDGTCLGALECREWYRDLTTVYLCSPAAKEPAK